MIHVLHWFASMVMLSVAVTHLEDIKLTHTRVVARAVGWMLVAVGAFCGVLEPLVPGLAAWSELGMTGYAVLAVAYDWQGATRYVRHR